MKDICAYCGKTVNPLYKWKNKNFCSSECRKEYKKENMRKGKKREERQFIPLHLNTLD